MLCVVSPNLVIVMDPAGSPVATATGLPAGFMTVTITSFIETARPISGQRRIKFLIRLDTI